MIPLEKAAELVAANQEPACLPCWHAEPGIRCGCVNDARAIITAFLEAAAADASTCVRVGDEASARAESSRYESGQDAILALKEAVG